MGFVLFAADLEPLGGTPTSILGTLLAISVALLGVVIWIVKKQFELQEKNSERLMQVALSLERILTHLKIGP